MFEGKTCVVCGKRFITYHPERDKCTLCKLMDAYKRMSDESENGIEVETFSDEYVVCPYCGDFWVPIHIAEEIYDEGSHLMECPSCGMDFEILTRVDVSFATSRIGGD